MSGCGCRRLAEDHADDLDLFLLDEQGRVVDSATTDAATESLTVHGLEAGTYTIDVQPWFVAEPSGDTTFTVRTFQVPVRRVRLAQRRAAAAGRLAGSGQLLVDSPRPARRGPARRGSGGSGGTRATTWWAARSCRPD